MKTFSYEDVPVEVTDTAQLAKIEGIIGQKTYAQASLDKAAPGLMAALAQEAKMCRDVGMRAEKFTVIGKTVKAHLSPDRRRLKDGVTIGDR